MATAGGVKQCQQWRVLPSVVRVRGGGVDAVVGGEDQEVVGAQELEPLGDRVIDLDQGLVEALDVVAVAVDLVGLD